MFSKQFPKRARIYLRSVLEFRFFHPTSLIIQFNGACTLKYRVIMLAKNIDRVYFIGNYYETSRCRHACILPGLDIPNKNSNA